MLGEVKHVNNQYDRVTGDVEANIFRFVVPEQLQKKLPKVEAEGKGPEAKKSLTFFDMP